MSLSWDLAVFLRIGMELWEWGGRLQGKVPFSSPRMKGTYRQHDITADVNLRHLLSFQMPTVGFLFPAPALLTQSSLQEVTLEESGLVLHLWEGREPTKLYKIVSSSSFIYLLFLQSFLYQYGLGIYCMLCIIIQHCLTLLCQWFQLWSLWTLLCAFDILPPLWVLLLLFWALSYFLDTSCSRLFLYMACPSYRILTYLL